MSCRRISSMASTSLCLGPTVTGSRIMPLSARLTLSTSRPCSSGVKFLCTMPSPPSRAIVTAARHSVTVSIALERMGMLSVSSRVRRVRTSASAGRNSE